MKKSPIQTAVDLLKKNGYTVTKKRADPRIVQRAAAKVKGCPILIP